MFKLRLEMAALVFPAAVVGAAVFATTPGQAQSDSSSSSSSEAGLAAPQDVPVYWNAERLKAAKPILPAPSKVGPEGLPEGSQLVSPQLKASPEAAKGEKGDGAAPSLQLEPGAE